MQPDTSVPLCSTPGSLPLSTLDVGYEEAAVLSLSLHSTWARRERPVDVDAGAPLQYGQSTSLQADTSGAPPTYTHEARSLGVQESCSFPHVTRGTRVMHLGDNTYAGGYTGLTIQYRCTATKIPVSTFAHAKKQQTQTHCEAASASNFFTVSTLMVGPAPRLRMKLQRTREGKASMPNL